MNDFDLMIEKYRCELIEAKKHSVFSMLDGPEMHGEADVAEPSAKNVGTEKAAPDILSGTLRVQVFSGDRVFPIASAHVVIKGSFDESVYFDGYTDENGITEAVTLPAPPRVLSEHPSNEKPYFQYDIFVEHSGFISQNRTFVPVFSGVVSIQNIQLVASLGELERLTDSISDSHASDTQVKCND